MLQAILQYILLSDLHEAIMGFFKTLAFRIRDIYFQWLRMLFRAVAAGLVLPINIVGSMVPTQTGPSFQSHWTNELALNQSDGSYTCLFLFLLKPSPS